MAASACAHWLSNRDPAGLVKLPLDTPNDGLAFDLIADQERIAQCGRRIVGNQDVGDRRAGGRGGSLRAGFELHSGVHVVRRADAQDQRPPFVGRNGIECPRGSAGTTGQRAQIVDRDVFNT